MYTGVLRALQTLLSAYRALLNVYRALLSVYWSLEGSTDSFQKQNIDMPTYFGVL